MQEVCVVLDPAHDRYIALLLPRARSRRGEPMHLPTVVIKSTVFNTGKQQISTKKACASWYHKPLQVHNLTRWGVVHSRRKLYFIVPLGHSLSPTIYQDLSKDRE